MNPAIVYYEPDALKYELGVKLKEKFANSEWIEIESHNNIPFLREKQNCEFAKMKQNIVIGVRKSHKYVPNHKTSDYLVPYTSSGCSAMCLYCYLVCNYNKCSYLRLFVNREQMMAKLIKTSLGSDKPLTFEIGSNSDLVLENTITDNLIWTIERFAKIEKGYITLPTKFDMVDGLLSLAHKGRVIIRMSVNPHDIISKIEFGTSPLQNRIDALNKLADAEYKLGILIAPVILVPDWEEKYKILIETLADTLSEKAKKKIFFEVIFMTYSYVHRMINAEAFPNAVDLFDKTLMTGRGRGKYCYKPAVRAQGEEYLRELLGKYFPENEIMYVV
ncbi:MAG: spore photoproduct lyase [Eubacteriaceae bacterium]|nr:spore photoproduct lyase [Eubacteriaceae bacterium]